MKQGYTIEEITEWFLHGEHNKKMRQPKNHEVYYTRFNKNETEGIFLQEHNTVIVLYRGVLHNPLGPAKIIFTKEGKPFYRIFARDGKIIQWDGFEAHMRQLQVEKKISSKEKESNDKSKID